MNFVNNIPNKVWLADLKDLQLENVQNQKLFLEIKNGVGGEMFYFQELYRKSDGTITVYNLEQILRPFVTTFLDVEIVVESEQEAPFEERDFFAFTVFYSEAEMQEPPELFLQHNFLTRNIEKLTETNAVENLWLVNNNFGADIEVKAQTYYLDGTNSLKFPLCTLEFDENEPIKYHQIDTSSQAVFETIQEPNPENVCAYSVEWHIPNQPEKGGTVFYIFNANTSKKTATFTYKNFFGVMENIAIYGVDETESKFEKQTAIANRNEFVYHTKITLKHNITTAITHYKQRDEIHDLFCSDKVFLLDGEGAPEPVIIDDVTHRVSDAYEATDSYKFSWRPTYENKRFKPKFARIFTTEYQNQFT